MANDKTLKTVQGFYKAGKIISTVIFVFCIIGIVGCIIGIFGVAVGFTGLKLGDVEIMSIIKQKAGITQAETYLGLIIGLLYCSTESVMCKLSKRYFANELEAGTPFTYDGANELKRLGITVMLISLGTSIIASIVVSILKLFFVIGNIDTEASSFGIGLTMLCLSFLLRYGASIKSENDLLKSDDM